MRKAAVMFAVLGWFFVITQSSPQQPCSPGESTPPSMSSFSVGPFKNEAQCFRVKQLFVEGGPDNVLGIPGQLTASRCFSANGDLGG